MSISEELERFFSSAEVPILFTGAGVSARAGLPIWKNLIGSLAEGLRANDPLITQVIYEKISKGNFTLAAEMFERSDGLVVGEKYKLLRKLLSPFDAKKIIDIGKLPVRGCLTTNFDRSIFDAMNAGTGVVPHDYKFGDSSFRSAQWDDELFVARIHGAVEAPESIVLSDSGFDSIKKNQLYIDVLGHFFVHKNVLFVGFSFYDPAIRFVLTNINERFGPAAPGRHIALVPRGSGNDFLQQAHRLNIRVVEYDGAEDHKELWDGVAAFNRTLKISIPKGGTKQHHSYALMKMYMASCYARGQLNTHRVALRESILEGVVSAHLQAAAPKPLLRGDLYEKIRLSVGITGKTAHQEIEAAVRALKADGLCERIKGHGKGDSFVWTSRSTAVEGLEVALEKLVDSAEKRARVQEGWKLDATSRDRLRDLFDDLVRRRGWDLGAAFAAGRPPEAVSVRTAIEHSLGNIPAFDRERLGRILTLMLHFPSQDEARILAELGRTSFAMEIAFQSPRSILLHKAVLPRRIYIDASILLPTIVANHPLNKIYNESFARVREAASRSALEFELIVLAPYLNEVISHRTKAIEYFYEAGPKFQSIAKDDALYHGPAKVNVFIGAYVCHLSVTNDDISFLTFLTNEAPYRDEDQLRRWLTVKGFKVANASKEGAYANINAALETSYADSLERGKTPLLIEHDALQLARLESDVSLGMSSLFITADKGLHRRLNAELFDSLRDALISHIGFVQLIDLMIGGVAEEASGFTDLIWSAQISTKGEAVRAFLLSKGLALYRAAAAMKLPELVDSYSDSIGRELDRIGVDFESESPSKRVQAFEKFGSLSENYFEKMNQEMDKIERRLSEGKG